MKTQFKVHQQKDSIHHQQNSFTLEMHSLFQTNQILARNKKQAQYQKLNLYQQKIKKLNQLLRKVDQEKHSNEKATKRSTSMYQSLGRQSNVKNSQNLVFDRISIHATSKPNYHHQEERSQQHRTISLKLRTLQEKRANILKKIERIQKIEQQIEGYTGFIGYARVKSKTLNPSAQNKVQQMTDQLSTLIPTDLSSYFSNFSNPHETFSNSHIETLVEKINQLFIFLFDQERNTSEVLSKETERQKGNQKAGYKFDKRFDEEDNIQGQKSNSKSNRVKEVRFQNSNPVLCYQGQSEFSMKAKEEQLQKFEGLVQCKQQELQRVQLRLRQQRDNYELMRQNVEKLDRCRSEIDQSMKCALDELMGLASKIGQFEEEDCQRSNRSKEDHLHLRRLLSLSKKSDLSVKDREKQQFPLNQNVFRSSSNTKRQTYLTNFVSLVKKVNSFVDRKHSQTINTVQNYSRIHQMINELKIRYGQEQSKVKRIMASVTDKESHNKQLSDIMARMTQQQLTLNQALKQTRKEITQSQNLAYLRTNNCQQLEKKYQILKKRKANLKQKSDVLQQNVNKKQSILDEITRKTTEKQQYLRQAQSKMNEILNEKQNIIAQLQLVQTKNQQQVCVSNELENCIKLSRRQLQQNTQILNSLAANLKAKQQQLHRKTQKCEATTRNLAEKQRMKVEVGQNLLLCKQELSQMQEQLPLLKTEIQKERMAKQELQQNMEQLSGEFKLLLKDVQEINQVKEKLSDQMTKMLGEKQQIQSKLDSKYSSHRQLTALIQGNAARLEQLSTLCESKQHQSQNLSGLINELQQNLNYIAQEQSKRQDQLEQINTLVEQNREQQINLFERIQKLKQIEVNIILKGVWTIQNLSSQHQTKIKFPNMSDPNMNSLLKRKASQIVKKCSEVESLNRRLAKQSRQNQKLNKQIQKLKILIEKNSKISNFNGQDTLIQNLELNFSREKAKSLRGSQVKMQHQQRPRNNSLVSTGQKKTKKISQILAECENRSNFGGEYLLTDGY